jgi:hypothetical protein
MIERRTHPLVVEAIARYSDALNKMNDYLDSLTRHSATFQAFCDFADEKKCEAYLPFNPEKNAEHLKEIKAKIDMRKEQMPGYKQAFDRDTPEATQPLKEAAENRMLAQFAQYGSPIPPEEAKEMQYMFPGMLYELKEKAIRQKDAQLHSTINKGK